MKAYNTDDIIYALATPWATGALAVIRISGDGCISKISEYAKCKRKLDSYESNSAVFCKYAGLDDVVITVFKDGHGFTGEDACEISCHGGLQVVKSILEHLSTIGFRKAERGEFTFRAFVHGKMDLTKAEAVNELINSKGGKSHEKALSRLEGLLLRRITRIKEVVLGVMSTVEVQLDYSEDEIGEDLDFPSEEVDKALSMIEAISRTFSTGQLYSQGAKIVLAGNTNAGKSSLFNYFLKEERAIVSNIEGTTRDFLESQCLIDGIPVRLFDTAGLREGTDAIEEEGIRRSLSLIEEADIILYLLDGEKQDKADDKLLKDSRTICVTTKTDLGNTIPGTVGISVVTGDGFDKLVRILSDKLKQGLVIYDDSELVIESKRQKENLDEAYNALQSAKKASEAMLPLDIISADIQEALEALGEITGEITTDDILDQIFSNFCVGK